MTTSCTTNTIQPWEAAASIALSLAIVAGVNRRWPTAAELLESDLDKDDVVQCRQGLVTTSFDSPVLHPGI